MFPVGAVANIDCIEHRGGSRGIELTLAIEGKIFNVFDEGDRLPAKKFFEPVRTEKDDNKRPFTIADVKNSDTFTHAAFVHSENSEGNHEVGDLQDLFRAAWGLVAEDQKIDFLCTYAAKSALSAPNSLFE